MLKHLCGTHCHLVYFLFLSIIISASGRVFCFCSRYLYCNGFFIVVSCLLFYRGGPMENKPHANSFNSREPAERKMWHLKANELRCPRLLCVLALKESDTLELFACVMNNNGIDREKKTRQNMINNDSSCAAKSLSSPIFPRLKGPMVCKSHLCFMTKKIWVSNPSVKWKNIFSFLCRLHFLENLCKNRFFWKSAPCDITKATVTTPTLCKPK